MEHHDFTGMYYYLAIENTVVDDDDDEHKNVYEELTDR